MIRNGLDYLGTFYICSSNDSRKRVGLIFDERMSLHNDPFYADHVENPNRIKWIWEKLQSAGISKKCVCLEAKSAEDNHVLSVHTQRHVEFIKKVSSTQLSRKDRKLAEHNDVYYNQGSSQAAFIAAGCVVELAMKVANGELSSGFAVVRPPGHHAEAEEAKGFCLLNNVAIAAKTILDLDFGIKRILILDIDVHHGNGTQHMFWSNPDVLYFSVHRYGNGFYPLFSGSHTEIGTGKGKGFNINVPWTRDKCRDSDYLAVWQHILIPVVRAFKPQMTIISAGFDAADGDSIGGCSVTAEGFSTLVQKVMEFSGGKVVMALEGGYDRDSLERSVLACVEVLLEENLTYEYCEIPLESTQQVIKLSTNVGDFAGRTHTSSHISE
ncbi:hypothetical protein RJ639_031579 [Escallonia herrerae]|uniref:Histone deacetylase domain-containing protein n=1 Tax=Escallonia herrerae TaxID=1293975 RepID=A0AA88X171_9ASTE|nr:hypothetical protein RJ639_031579 [Escallonia herrerae]